ncbi:MAG: ABC transporter ATP-binding protein [Caldilineaceae bacterium]|nr:ABC transporter ATP-binding protein [Caldilineaceae bacterium]
MKRLFGFLKPHKPLLIALVFVNVLLSAMLIVAPLVIKQIVDVVIDEGQMQLLLPYLALLLIVMAVRAVTTYFYSFGQNKLGQLVMTTCAPRSIASCWRCPTASTTASRPVG